MVYMYTHNMHNEQNGTVIFISDISQYVIHMQYFLNVHDHPSIPIQNIYPHHTIIYTRFKHCIHLHALLSFYATTCTCKQFRYIHPNCPSPDRSSNNETSVNVQESRLSACTWLGLSTFQKPTRDDARSPAIVRGVVL